MSIPSNHHQPQLIIACDFASLSQMQAFLKQLPAQSHFLKVGMEFLYHEGFTVLKLLKQAGHRLFVDLKLFDTPNTVFQALTALRQYEPDFITVHLNGGVAMLRAAVAAVATTKTKIIGVTTLTSLDYSDVVAIYPNYHGYQGKDFIQMINVNLITNAMMAGIDHIVCAVEDSLLLKKLEPHLITFCPGISVGQDVARLQGQKRVAKLSDALEQQVDYPIVGRALTLSGEPAKVYAAMMKTLGSV